MLRILTLFCLLSISSSLFSQTHLFWYKAVEKGYNLSGTPGPAVTGPLTVHEGKVISSMHNSQLGSTISDFAIGSGLDDAQGRCATVWFQDLNHMTGYINQAKLRGEFRDGYSIDAYCNQGPIRVRLGVVDFSGNLKAFGNEDNILPDAVWQDPKNPMSSTMGFNEFFPSLMAETTITLTAPAGRPGDASPSVLDKQFFEIDVTNQVHWILTHTGTSKGPYGGNYAIALLVAPGQGSTGKINLYASEGGTLPDGSDAPWTPDGNTIHLWVDGVLRPILPSPFFIGNFSAMWTPLLNAGGSAYLAGRAGNAYVPGLQILMNREISFTSWDDSLQTDYYRLLGDTGSTLYAILKDTLNADQPWLHNGKLMVVPRGSPFTDVLVGYQGPLYGEETFSAPATDIPALAFSMDNRNPAEARVNSFSLFCQGYGWRNRIQKISFYQDQPDSGGRFGTFNPGDTYLTGRVLTAGDTNPLLFTPDPLILAQNEKKHLLFTLDLSGIDSSSNFNFSLQWQSADCDKPVAYHTSGYRFFKGARQFSFDSWYDADSSSVALGWNGFRGTVTEFKLWRDGDTLVLNQAGPVFRWYDRLADIRTHHLYRLELRYDDNSGDTLTRDYFPPIFPVFPPERFYTGSELTLKNALQASGGWVTAARFDAGSFTLFSSLHAIPATLVSRYEPSPYNRTIYHLLSDTGIQEYAPLADSTGNLWLSAGQPVVFPFGTSQRLILDYAGPLSGDTVVRMAVNRFIPVLAFSVENRSPDTMALSRFDVRFEGFDWFKVVNRLTLHRDIPDSAGLMGTFNNDPQLKLLMLTLGQDLPGRTLDFVPAAVAPGQKMHFLFTLDAVAVDTTRPFDVGLKYESIFPPAYTTILSLGQRRVMGPASNPGPTGPPSPYCGLPQALLDTLKTHGSFVRLPGDTGLHNLTRVNDPYAETAFPGAVLLLGKIDNSAFIDTLVLMGRSGDCGRMWQAANGNPILMRLRDVDAFKPAYLYVNFNADSGFLMVYWGNFKKAVNGYALFRNMVRVADLGPNVWSWTDRIADANADHDYRIMVYYQDSSADSLSYHFSKGGTGPAPLSFFCGTQAQYGPFLTGRTPAVMHTWDATVTPAALQGSPFTLPSLPGYLFAVARWGSTTDTVVALGESDSCAAARVDSMNRVLLVPFDEVGWISGPKFASYFMPESGGVVLYWWDISQPLNRVEILRDTAKIKVITDGSVWSHVDRAVNPDLEWDYRLLLFFTDGKTDTLSVHYQKGTGPGPGAPSFFCGSETLLDSIILARNGAAAVHSGDSVQKPVTPIGNPAVFRLASIPGFVFMVGNAGGFTDTFVALGRSGACDSMLSASDGRPLFTWLKEADFIRGPRLYVRYHPDSGALYLDWASARTTGVTGFALTRDGAAAGTFAGDVGGFCDRAADPAINHSYILAIVSDSGTRNIGATWRFDPKDLRPPFYAGTPAMLSAEIAARGVKVFLPWDSVARPVTLLGPPFSLSSLPGKVLVLGRQTASTQIDTLIAFGGLTDSSKPLLYGSDQAVLFARLNEYPFLRGPRLLAWYQFDSNAVYLYWGGLKDSVGSLALLRNDSILMAGTAGGRQSYLDRSADSSLSYHYKLLIYYIGGRSPDSLVCDYSRDPGNHDPGGFYFKGPWTVKAGFSFNLASMTGSSGDLGRAGIGLHWGIKPDSVEINTATGRLTTPVTFAVSFKPAAGFSFSPFRTFSVSAVDSLSGNLALDTLIEPGLYQFQAVVTHGGRADTLSDFFPAGAMLSLGSRQSLSINLARMAAAALGLTPAAVALSGLVVNGTPTALPSGGLYSVDNAVSTVDSRYIPVSYKVNGKPFGLVIELRTPFDDGRLLKARIDPSMGFVTLTGEVLVGLGGEGFESAGSGNQGKPGSPRFDSLILSAGSVSATFRLPLDSGTAFFNSGPDFPGKRIRVRAIDTALGLTVDAVAGRVFHLAPSDRTVRGLFPTGETLYQTVGEALAAGARDIRLGADYLGMPFSLEGMTGVTITGEVSGASKPRIFGDGNPGCVRLSACKDITLRGLSFEGGAMAVAAEGSEAIRVRQSFFMGSYCAMAAFASRGGEMDTAAPTGPRISRGISVVNCLFSEISGLTAIFDQPVNCRFVNNTVVRSGHGAFFGRGGDSRNRDTLALTGNLAANNLFDRCKTGVLIGRKWAGDSIDLSVTANLFRLCDSGGVVLCNTSGMGLPTTALPLPAGNLSTADSACTNDLFPFVPVPGGPAVNAGIRLSGLTPDFDFRASPRPLTDSLDIGAIEGSALEPGIHLTAVTSLPGCARIACRFIMPDSGTAPAPALALTRDGAVFTPARTARTGSGETSTFDLWPLPDGAYAFTLSASLSVSGSAKTFTREGGFTIAGNRMVLPAGEWSMAGATMAADSLPKAASGLSELSDSTLYFWDQENESYRHAAELDTPWILKGRAYWNLPDSEVTLASDPLLFTGGDTTASSIRLIAGWNMVTSPFPFPVRLSQGPAYAWNAVAGGYDPLEAIPPVAGCWVFSGTDTLIPLPWIPVVPAALAKPVAPLFRGRSDWRIVFNAFLGRYSDRGNVIGFSPAGNADLREPPMSMGGISAWFEPASGGTHEQLCRSLVAAENGTRIWTLVLNPGANSGEAKITAEGADALSEGLYCFAGDPAAGFTDLSRNPELRIMTSGGLSRLLVMVTDDPALPQTMTRKLELAQNAPNPFNPATAISFFVPYGWDRAGGILRNEAFADLSIYNAQGRKVATLAHGRFQAGQSHRVLWNTGEGRRSLASGVYFCRLTCGKFEKVRKMVLMR